MIKVDKNHCTISGDLAEVLVEFEILFEAIRATNCPELLEGLVKIIDKQIKELGDAENNTSD